MIRLWTGGDSKTIFLVEDEVGGKVKYTFDSGAVRILGVIFVLSALQSSPAQAETYYVDVDNCPGPGAGTPADPFCSIQAGIDAASSGDTVQVDAGTYLENITMKSGVVIQGAGQGVSIIDGGATGSVVTANGVDSEAKLDGFTITNGQGLYDGGGMYNLNSSPTVSNCTFAGNSAGDVIPVIGLGGGMYNSNSSPAVINCTFSGNSAMGGGGGMYNLNSSPTVTGCNFSNNSAEQGGGMYNLSSFPTVTGCTFSGNSSAAWTWGGGMVNDNSSPTVLGCTFVNNSAGTFGGGMLNYGSSSPVVANCIFNMNNANGQFGRDMANRTVSASPKVINSTFRNASYSMYNDGSSPTVTNSIFWGGGFDMIWNVGTASPVVTYCDIEGGSGWVPPGVGNINANPLFVDESNGDLRLQPSSPCIDAGDNSDPDLPTVDIEGDDRRIDDPTVTDTGNGSPPIVDIGADEFDPSGIIIFVDGFESGDCTAWSTTVGEVS